MDAKTGKITYSTFFQECLNTDTGLPEGQKQL